MNDEQHGTRAGFESDCPCDECRIAYRAHQQNQWWRPKQHARKPKERQR